MKKVKAHSTQEDIEQGRITPQHKLGNETADHWAGEGALINEAPWQLRSRVKQLDSVAWLVQDRIAHIVQTQLEPSVKPPKEDVSRPPVYTLGDQITDMGHTRYQVDETTEACWACGQSWHKGQRQLIVSHGRCPGPSIWGDMPQNPECPFTVPEGTRITFRGVDVHPTHRLRWNRGIIYCAKCGSYGIKRIAKLADPCLLKPAPTSVAVLKRLRSGLPPTPYAKFPLEASAIPGMTPGNEGRGIPEPTATPPVSHPASASGLDGPRATE